MPLFVRLFLSCSWYRCIILFDRTRTEHLSLVATTENTSAFGGFSCRLIWSHFVLISHLPCAIFMLNLIERNEILSYSRQVCLSFSIEFSFLVCRWIPFVRFSLGFGRCRRQHKLQNLQCEWHGIIKMTKTTRRNGCANKRTWNENQFQSWVDITNSVKQPSAFWF